MCRVRRSLIWRILQGMARQEPPSIIAAELATLHTIEEMTLCQELVLAVVHLDLIQVINLSQYVSMFVCTYHRHTCSAGALGDKAVLYFIHFQNLTKLDFGNLALVTSRKPKYFLN